MHRVPIEFAHLHLDVRDVVLWLNGNRIYVKDVRCVLAQFVIFEPDASFLVGANMKQTAIDVDVAIIDLQAGVFKGLADKSDVGYRATVKARA